MVDCLFVGRGMSGLMFFVEYLFLGLFFFW